ncbi:class I SAM-dependent methyltransferase [Vineibacter terrae]|uniref:class I SAM-dependent methyltransferase n=1 Tax=Vineibacter terrae TaxID=2586908 RepID=UPI002E354E9B|nr:50S ribosomal protein L11 methyltransferase [Vineibacter terrae]HEX2890854.1 50S ribosomal protein L11 methyltransferase [Vineibacter terrae]
MAGRHPDPEAFIRAHTALERPALVPELALWLAAEYLPIWQATEDWLEKNNIDPPYWAFCWPGGQAVARYLLDNPAMVAGRTVIDFAAGGGVATIAAMKAGAASGIGNDIDPMAVAAIGLNALANGVDVQTDASDWLAGAAATPEAGVVIAGDVCYEREMTARAMAWLRGHAAAGRLVLLGDPGRNYFQADRLQELARYQIPTSLQLENRGLRETTVWRVLP